MNDPPGDGGDSGYSSVGGKTKISGGEGEREDHPYDGGIIMSTAMHDHRHEYTPMARVVLTFTLTTVYVYFYVITISIAIAAVVGGVVHTTAHAVGTKRKVTDVEGDSENHPRHGVVHEYTVIASVLLCFTLTSGDFRTFADHAASTIAAVLLSLQFTRAVM